jgi:hypothetical protein
MAEGINQALQLWTEANVQFACIGFASDLRNEKGVIFKQGPVVEDPSLGYVLHWDPYRAVLAPLRKVMAG